MELTLKPVNETYVKVLCDDALAYELQDKYSSFAKNYQHDWRFKKKRWDGKIRAFSAAARLLPKGLIRTTLEWAEKRGHVVFDETAYERPALTDEQIQKFISAVTLGEDIEERDYQINCFRKSIEDDRWLFLAATSSGKSYSIYLTTAWHVARRRKVLIIVPRTGLVRQMAKEFDFYSDGKMTVSQIMSGADKTNLDWVTVSTWQSLAKMPKGYFEQFDVVFGDEVHMFEAKSLVYIMNACINARYRYGFTGTLNGAKTNETSLIGMFGPICKIISAKELIDRGYAAPVRIKILNLEYSAEDRDALKAQESAKYREFTGAMQPGESFPAVEFGRWKLENEKEFLMNHEGRNAFLQNLVAAFKKNSFVLFDRVEHGKKLVELFEEVAGARRVNFVYAKVDVDDREEIRDTTENAVNDITVASYQTFGTGTNIKNLHHLVYAMASKGRVKTLQAIGRVLRLMATDPSKVATVYDIADNLSVKSRENYAMIHLQERIGFYDEEGYDYEIINIRLSDFS